MANNAAVGALAQLGTSASGNATQAFEFVSESIRKTGTVLERDGLRGSRSHQGTAARLGPYGVGGTLVLEPNPEDLAIWLPRILGGAANGTSYPLAETLPEFDLWVDRVTKVFQYTACKVNRATLSASSADPTLRLSLDLVGKTEAVANAATFPTLTITDTQFYIFSDLVFTCGNTARQVAGFSLTIDNSLATDRFMNSLTLTDIPATDRVISLAVTLGYTTENVDLHGLAVSGPAATNSLVFTNGNYSTSFVFGALHAPDETPTVEGRGEIPITKNFIAKKSGATAEITVTHDSTP